MKNKSGRHKESNTFKFLSFSERIANINIDIFHRIGHEYEDQNEEAECYFFQSIQKWNVLNLTEAYDTFRKDVMPHTLITLPQLLHKKELVISVLLKHLKLKNILCLQPLLELTVALVQDLRKDFYPYYPEFLEVLIELLNTKETEQLEWTFITLAYIFKFLWRTLIKDIGFVLKTLLPLLSDNKPQYINEFAAESFAFVARKVKDRKTFLALILKAVHTNQDGISGCGKLLFEVLKGVNGHFNSTADTMLPFLLESTTDEKLAKKELDDILEVIVAEIVHKIHPQNSILFWKSIINLINFLSEKWQKDQYEIYLKKIDFLLKLCGQALEYKNGRFLQDSLTFVKELSKLLSLQLPEENLMTLSKLSILILLSKNVKLGQEQASELARKILTLKCKNVILYFVENIVEFSSFEVLILPAFLKFCLEFNLDNDCFFVLTKVVMKKAPLSKSGINLLSWNKYTIDFGRKEYNNMVGEILTKNIFFENTTLFETYFCSLVCIPHIVLCDRAKVKVYLIKNFVEFCNSLSLAENETTTRKKLFLLQNTLECIFHITKEEDLNILFPLILEKILHLCSNPTYLVALNIVDMFLTFSPKLINFENLLKLHVVLENNFSSSEHEVRLLTTHIYSLFNKVPNLNLKNSTEDWNIFHICYAVESISPQVDTYRDQLQNLEKLSFEKQQMQMCKNTEFKLVPLRYLCGVLYMNFQLLWDPVSNIINSHAHGLNQTDFWLVFGKQLKFAAEHAKNKVTEKNIDLECNCEFIKDLYFDMYKLEGKPDYVNYRLLLWKTLFLFPEVAEAKTRDVSELFLKFIEQEYMKSNSEVALTWNIKQNDSEEDSEDFKNEDHFKKEFNKPVPKQGGRNNFKALLYHMKIFSKIKSPKSMYREPELYKLYFEFLSHKNPEIQKAALDCLMTYKFKYLTPYQEQLYGLVDDKNFKNELAAFNVSKDSNVILQEHREGLMPIVMKIVFSKMFAKTGLRTGGKSSGQLRRNLVLRFLAGCQEEEMYNFIIMAFRYYNSFIEDDPEKLALNIFEKTNLEKFIPPKRLQSSLNLLNVVLEQFGGLMGEKLLKYFLKILFVIGSTIKSAFVQIDKVHPGYYSVLKNLRAAAIKIIARFFEHFDKYVWSLKELNTIFNIFVWPYLDKLSIEGIHSPTSLLKLFMIWGSNPKYFCLLMKQEENSEKYIMPYLMMLLLNEKSNASVCNSILEIVEKLLSLEQSEEDTLPVENLRPVEQNIIERLALDERLNYGSCILLPHAMNILEKIKFKLNNKNKNLNQRELFILSRISELVWEPNISDVILKLLLPLVLKKCTLGCKEEIVLQYMKTLHNLIKNVINPEIHLKLLSPLFSFVQYPASRKILCNILDTIAVNYPQLKGSSELIKELNAWDSKWIEQPDYEKRLDAFKKIEKLTQEDDLILELGVLLIYDCYFIIQNEKDLSLRENAAHSWKNISVSLIRKTFSKEHSKNNHKYLTYILDDCIFNIIRQGLKRDDVIRNECIYLLGHLARECPEASPILRDLNKLTNKMDPEVDFFENLTHLQLHRHCRALLKFCQVFKKEDVAPNVRTMTQFILPLTCHYLLAEKYTTKNSLVDAAVETVGLISKLLPWHQYEGLLKFYLEKLRNNFEFQRQLVKIIVVILDSFHFDLTKGNTLENETKDVGSVNESETGKEIAVNFEEETKIEETNENEVKDEEMDKEQEEELEIDKILEGINDKEEDYEEKSIFPVKPSEKITVLCRSTANRVIKTIQIVLLPQLHKSLAFLTQHESSHKVNRKRTGIEREEEDLQRVPISLAVVKLLQRLPKTILDANLPGIFMKLCTFLKSQLESVRRVTRETLQKIMTTLGPEYLGLLINEMATLLSRGFQVHVLIYTIHAVLVALKELYKPQDIDKILLTVVNLCKTDLFGATSEEKEVLKIVSKISEAKSSKSCVTLQILAQYCTDKCLMDLIMPLKEVVMNSLSFKTVSKTQECFKHIVFGLVDNSFITVESLLKLAYGVASESIPQLFEEKNKPELSEKEREKLARLTEDCFIIPKNPVGRLRVTSVKNNKTNSHVIVEFGLKLCFFLLKRDKVKNEDYLPYMDPFVIIFKKCLLSKNVKLCTVTLQCLSKIMKYDLPSMKENIKDIADAIFAILHKYGSAGLSKGDNFDLVVAAFKTMSILVRDVKYHIIDTEQLKILLIYVEQDLYDHDRQATAFGLLKSIISRKLIITEIHGVMDKVAKLSIISELDHVRTQSRIIFLQYLLEYPLGDSKIGTYVAFFIMQLSYDLQSGRESAIEMIHNFINSFPKKLLKEHSTSFLLMVGARLVNEEIPQCKKMIAECLTSMFMKLPKPNRDPLFDIILAWLKDKKMAHRQMAAQICGLLVAVEKSSFESRIPKLLPLLSLQFGIGDEDRKPGKFVLLKNNEKEDESINRVKDHNLFQVLQLCLKICTFCPSFLKNMQEIQEIGVHVQTLLNYPHDWVRLAAAQFIGFILNSLDVNTLSNLIKEEKTQIGYLYNNPLEGIKSLTLDLCSQLQPSVKSNLAEQVIKNLVFIARILNNIKNDKINLFWLAKRMRKIVNTEIIETPSNTTLRTEVFKWIAAIFTALDFENLESFLDHLLVPLVREMMTAEESNAPLRQLSKEVGKLIKKKIGLEEYTKRLSKLQQHITIKRADRKRVQAQLAVTNPEIFTKKKIKKLERKKEAKKRKIQSGKGVIKKGKKRKIELDDVYSDFL